MLIFYLRPARSKARTAATAEALSLLRDLDATAPAGGPLSDRGGVFWIDVQSQFLEKATDRLPRLGYSCAVDLLDRAADQANTEFIRWRGESFRLRRLYEENAEASRENAPDRRAFLFEDASGVVREIRGYRGDGDPLSRRGLPVYDARLLVNLVRPANAAHRKFLDPFGGIGGVIIEARASGYDVASIDIDRALRHGLSALGSSHCVGDARQLPFPSATFDAIATEPPYHESTRDTVVQALAEMARVVKGGGRIAMLCASWQADDLRKRGETLGLRSFLDSEINRKGLGVTVLAWEKPG